MSLDDLDLSSVVIPLLKGVLYREESAALWRALLELQPRVRDYVAVLGLELVCDEVEGYAFLRHVEDAAETDDALSKRPRLISRRPLSYPVSLLLALLRKKLAEMDAQSGETRLILAREEVLEMLRLFMPDLSNEARLADQVDGWLNKVVELGFVRRLKPASDGAADLFEVRRILKAYVDAQWLSEFNERLSDYRQAREQTL